MILRYARPGDEFGMADIHIEGWRVAYHGIYAPDFLDGSAHEEKADIWAQRIAAETPHNAQLVFDNDGIIGFISLVDHHATEERSTEGRIHAFYVHLDYHRKGIAEQLMNAATGWFKANGYKAVFVQTLKRSKHFFEKDHAITQTDTIEITLNNKRTVEVHEYRWEL